MSDFKNCLSKNIHIFPISFDRSQVGETTQYWIRNNTAYSGEDSDIKEYLEENLVLSAEPDDLYEDYYVLTNTTYAPSNSYSNGRILSEKNISALINALTTEHNFVVSADISSNVCKSIEFIIKGRYFALNFDPNDTDFSTKAYDQNLWVGVKFIDTNSIETEIDEFETLYAYDNSVNIAASGAAAEYIDKLMQVDFFIDEEPGSWSNYSEHLHLLEKLSDGTLRVPIASKFRFDDTAVSHINGGTV